MHYAISIHETSTRVTLDCVVAFYSYFSLWRKNVLRKNQCPQVVFRRFNKMLMYVFSKIVFLRRESEWPKPPWLTEHLCTFLCQTNVQYSLKDIFGSTITKNLRDLCSNLMYFFLWNFTTNVNIYPHSQVMVTLLHVSTVDVSLVTGEAVRIPGRDMLVHHLTVSIWSLLKMLTLYLILCKLTGNISHQ